MTLYRNIQEEKRSITPSSDRVTLSFNPVIRQGESVEKEFFYRLKLQHTKQWVGGNYEALQTALILRIGRLPLCFYNLQASY